jgi:hypothetical protein
MYSRVDIDFRFTLHSRLAPVNSWSTAVIPRSVKRNASSVDLPISTSLFLHRAGVFLERYRSVVLPCGSVSLQNSSVSMLQCTIVKTSAGLIISQIIFNFLFLHPITPSEVFYSKPTKI